MSSDLVSVITPVFNGAPFLRECIDSVLAQTHHNFEYIIADNCSTDDTLSIARSYAGADERVRVLTFDSHVGPIQNWNRSLDATHPDSQFVKYVHADDWLFPECVERMVALAQAQDSVGIVSAHRLEEDRISLDRLPQAYAEPRMARELVMDGREVARAVFREFASVLGSPTALLLRTEAVKQHTPFFDESYLHADKDACIRVLGDWDLGFVREVLTFTRRHNESVTSLTNTLDSRRQEDLLILKRRGKDFLSADELESVLRRTARLYYAFLARSVGTAKGRDFWRSHRENLAKASMPYSRLRLLGALLRHWLDPRSAFKHVREQRAVASPRHSAAAADSFLAKTRRQKDVALD